MISVLLTNITFSGRTGTEVATLELANALRKRGNRVVIFSPKLGPTAHEARKLGIPVTDKIEHIGFTPDIIHGNHNCTLAVALIRFPNIPAIFVCHDSSSIFDEPIIYDRIGMYVAVDAACRDRLIVDGVEPRKIDIIANAVDLEKFPLRANWPTKLETALLIVKNHGRHIDIVRRACQKANVKLEIVGEGVGNVVSDLAQRCRKADVVLAHSRSALEAVAVGAGVIIIDDLGYDGWFGRDQILDWPETSLSHRILRSLPSDNELAETMLGYRSSVAKAISISLRECVDLSSIVRRWEHVYKRAISNVTATIQTHQNSAILNQTPLAVFVSKFLTGLDDSSALRKAGERMRRQQHIVNSYLYTLIHLSEKPLVEILFHPGSLGQLLLNEGWHDSEEWGVWSIAARAVLVLPELIISRWNFCLIVECFRYIPISNDDDSGRTVSVFVGSHLIDTWTFTAEQKRRPQQFSISLPLGIRPMPGQSIRLTFQIERPVVPADVGEGHDKRALGLALIALRPGSPEIADPERGGLVS